MGTGVRRYDGFRASNLRYVIPTKVGTHTEAAALKRKRHGEPCLPLSSK